MATKNSNDHEFSSLWGPRNRRAMMTDMMRFAGACALTPKFNFREIRTVLSPSESPVVATSSGKVRGAVVNGIHNFRGIPYGASTAGRNRFMPPRKPEPWSGVRDALDNGHICPQVVPPGGTGPVAWRNEARTMPQGEDCLVLNVFTPGVNDGRKRPVMFWCHGGGFQYEAGSLSRFDGNNLARRGDVVVVSPTHRLNIFGFLDLSGIGGKEYAESGNVAILDSLLALEWVRDNIARFGGDPGNVMLFGQSAGGGTVNTLLTMPSAKGLIHKATVQSGSSFGGPSHEDAIKTTQIVLDKLGFKASQVDQLQTAPVERLLAIAFGPREPGQPTLRFAPVVDGHVLPSQPFDPTAPEVSADVPMLIGTTATETTYFIGLGDPTAFTLTDADMRTRLQKIVGESTDSLIDLYRKSRPGASPSDIFFAITTDKQIRKPAIVEAERKVGLRRAPAYMYLMTWETPVEGGKWKSPHSVDLPFVWDNVDKLKDEVGTGPELQPLADKMSGAWTAFAHTGNPSTSSLKWPAYTLTERATMIFDNQCKVVNDPQKEERLAIAKT